MASAPASRPPRRPATALPRRVTWHNIPAPSLAELFGPHWLPDALASSPSPAPVKAR